MDITALNAAQKYSASRQATEPLAGQAAAGSAFQTLAKDFAATLSEGLRGALLLLSAAVGQAPKQHGLLVFLAEAGVEGLAGHLRRAGRWSPRLHPHRAEAWGLAHPEGEDLDVAV